MAAAYTPGPWEIDEVVSDGPYDIILGYDIPGAGRPILIASTLGPDEHGPIDAAKAKANARLIAAAPEMIFALRAALIAWGDKVMVNGYEHDALKLINAAIAKAEGKS